MAAAASRWRPRRSDSSRFAELSQLDANSNQRKTYWLTRDVDVANFVGMLCGCRIDCTVKVLKSAWIWHNGVTRVLSRSQGFGGIFSLPQREPLMQMTFEGYFSTGRGTAGRGESGAGKESTRTRSRCGNQPENRGKKGDMPVSYRGMCPA